jgi:transcription elongation factor/antiterminator RfaH
MRTCVENWYVIHCKPHREKQVDAYLAAKGFDTFYPTYRVRSAGSGPPRSKPFFPQYLFVKAALDASSPPPLNWIPGTVGMVKYGDTPATVPEQMIHQLQVRVAEIAAAGGVQHCPLRSGERVHIVRGPLAGCEAIFDLALSGTERVRVLLQMLGRQVRVDIRADAIEKTQ